MVILRPIVIQRRRARWHAEKNYGHSTHLFAIQRRSCPMAHRDKLWSFCAFLSRLDRVRWHAKTNYGHSVPYCHPEAASLMTCRDKLWSFHTPFRHPEAIVFDGAQRQIMVILRLSVQARSCSMACREKLWSFYALLSSRGDEPDDMQRQIMVILHTFSPSRGDRVQWRSETYYGHSAPFRPGSIVSDGTQRQIMVILRPFVI